MDRLPVEFRASPVVMRLMVVGNLLFIVGGAFLLLLPSSNVFAKVAGGLGIVTFGFFLALTLSEIRKPRIRFWIDAEGVHSRHVLSAYDFDLPWTMLLSAEATVYLGQPMLLLHPVDPEWGMDLGNDRARGTKRTNRALVGAWMALSPRVYGERSSTMLDAIARHRPDPAKARGAYTG